LKLITVSAAVAFAACLAACGKPEAPPAAPAAAPSAARETPGRVVIPADSPRLEQVRVEAVALGEAAIDEVISPGKLEVNPNRISRILLPVTGRVASVAVRVGDAVQSGQTLLTVESPDADAAESAYLQAEAAITQARAAAAKAQADFDRASDLYEHQAIAKKDVLNTESVLTQTKAAVDQTLAAREQALRRLQILGLKPGSFGQTVAVKAAISGKVLDMNVVPGEFRNDPNSPLMTIADLSSLWVSADVPESAIRLIQQGEKVEITLLAFPGETFVGRVTRIADTVDPQTRTVKVRAELANSGGRFLPEMFARIRHTEGTRQVPVVPAAAVIQGDGSSIVFVEKEKGVFEQRPVETGKRQGALLPVTSGLKVGEKVVVDGVMLLKAR
jgi:membrane fusion protein, heavy metal efflux system